MLRVVEISSALILIRNLYRIVEFEGGYGGYVMNHELYFYFFDALMMLFVQTLYSVVHPGKIFAAINTSKAIDAINV